MRSEQEGPPAYITLGVEEFELEEFIKTNRVWQSMLAEIELRQEIIVSALLDPAPETQKLYGSDDTKRGRHNELEWLMQLPMSILADMKISKEENKEKKDAERE